MSAVYPSARDIARIMGGDVCGRDAVSVPAPGHSREDRSLSIKLDDRAPDGFIVYSFAGDDPITCRDYVRFELGLASWQPGNDIRRMAPPPRPPRSSVDDGNEHRRIERAMAIWHQAVPPAGTIVEAYLRSRGLILPAIVVRGDHLRFHPVCPFGTQRLPAMVSLMTDPVTGEPRAVHRTALKPDGSGKSDHPDLDGNAKRMLGAAKGTIIRLCADDEVTMGLGLSEGVENGLAVICAGFMPVWAAGSAGNIASFPILAGVESLTIFADPGDAGELAARACGACWSEAGREVVARFPDNVDWNDTQRGARS
jgi:hypothetical protein